jgi:hypothetical protein
MMRSLALLFGFIALYGLTTAHMGGALLALLAVGLCVYGEKHFVEQDRKWANDPANAREAKPDTLTQLEQHECECMRSKDTA